MKKCLSVLLALIIAVMALGFAPTALAAPTKVVMGVISFNVIPEDVTPVTDAVNKYIAETYPDANVAVELKLFGPAEYGNKMNLMMQSGDPLDIYISAMYSVDLANGAFMPLNSYLDEYGKELVAIIKEGCGENIFDAFTEDGQIMAVPVNKDMRLTPTVQLDAAMLEATGYTMDDIYGLESLEPIFDKILELYPGVYPYVSTDVANGNLPYLYQSDNDIDLLGTSNGYGVVIGDEPTVVNLYESQAFIDVCNLMKRWYDKGYMPKDMATSTMRGMDYLFAQRAFSTFASYAGTGEMGPMLTVTYGRPFDAKLFAGSYFTTDSTNIAMAVPSTSRNPEAAVKFLNILYTDEFVLNTLQFGREGIDYVKVNDYEVAFPEGKTAETVSYCQYLCNGVWGTDYIMWNLATADETTPEEREAYLADRMTVNTTAKRSPYFGFRFDAANVRNELVALDNVVTQYRSGLLCGSVDVESTLEAFNNALRSAGLEKVMEEKQAQLDAWIAAQQQ
jgi:putative aldouronate transport system substrate-binding protein